MHAWRRLAPRYPPPPSFPAQAHGVLNPITQEPVAMRIGMHSGPVVSGVVGARM